jgi:hypothetical protein
MIPACETSRMNKCQSKDERHDINTRQNFDAAYHSWIIQNISNAISSQLTNHPKR